MTKYILTRDVETGQTAKLPEHLLEIFPNLEVTVEEVDCSECSIDLKEPEAPAEVLEEPEAPAEVLKEPEAPAEVLEEPVATRKKSTTNE